MGGLRGPLALWALVAFALVLLGTSADSDEVDTDLIFDSEQSISNDPMIERHLEEQLLSEEDENWFSGTVHRLKRSISDLFSNGKDGSKKVHTKKSKHHLKKAHNKTKKPDNKRMHRQTDLSDYNEDFQGQVEAAEEYDVDNLDENVGQQEVDEEDETIYDPSFGADDEDNFVVSSGDHESGTIFTEIPIPSTHQPDFNEPVHPRIYRVTITIEEMYNDKFDDRNSEPFQEFSRRVRKSVDDIFEKVPGDQHATVISIQRASDQFKVLTTVDIDSTWSNSTEIKNALYDPITRNHRLGDLVVLPDNFSFQEFGECPDGLMRCQSGECIQPNLRCDGKADCSDSSDETGCMSSGVGWCPIDQFKCRNGECVAQSGRCNGLRDCFDNSDEENCSSGERVPSKPVPETTLAPETTQTPELTTVESDVVHIDEPEGSGHDCRADDSVRCTDGSYTICADQVCDGIPDCADGGDERDCGVKTPTDCAQGEFQCDVTRCIPISQHCDGKNDCTDGSDEISCTISCHADEFSCDDTCIPIENKCDGVRHCLDNSDEADCPQQTCATDEFRCDGRCVSLSKKCDGVNDCVDNSDEDDCKETQQCRPGQFACGDGTCIPENSRCDGRQDCRSGLDEQNCRTGPEVRCPDGEFPCAEGFCIMDYKRCNGYNDCPGGSDEDNCPSSTELPVDCPSGQVRCTGGGCVEGQRCDGIIDCLDSSDEKRCRNRCHISEFRCNDGWCIDERLRCDGFRDCKDSSDEENCVTGCPGDQFRCKDGLCLDAQRRCNGKPDCVDGSDEENCGGNKNITSACDADHFDCGNGECIDKEFVCDGVEDCANYKDEEGCKACASNEFQCSNGRCIPFEKQCDGYADCDQNEDEEGCDKPCSSHELRCANGDCIPLHKQCDGYKDCLDGSDEICPCTSDQFQCQNDGRCIDKRARCDGRSDCTDSSDEYNCPPQPQPETTIIPETTQKPCYGRCNINNQCYTQEQFCDGRQDCPDGTDENRCPCQNHEFQCSNGQCIDRSLQCDRKYDCSDGSDESNCNNIIPTQGPSVPASCPPGYQTCSTSNQCILREQLCDGRVDCNDMSDETNCPGTSTGLDLHTFPDTQEQKERQEVVYTCRDEGPLRVPVTWERPNGQPLPPGSSVNRGRLEIPHIRMEDAGTYVCVAQGYPPQTPGAQKMVQLRVIRREYHITPRPPTACGLSEATCSNGDCIPKTKVCDGVFDCADGSDESRCNPNGCEPNEFQCSNKRCVPKNWRCDSDNDCGDESDEQDCATNPPGFLCQYHQFACNSNNQCIPKSYQCDMERDCLDGSDEIGCAKPVISSPPPPRETLSVGATFQIMCTAVGVPTPLISWRLNWGHIPSNCVSKSENGVGTLTCENVQEYNQGAYSCEALNTKGNVLAVPDTILIVERHSVCRAGYFNVQARNEGECIKCFCFGHTSDCRSADLYIYQFEPPFDSLKLLGVRVDPMEGVIDIRDEPIYSGVQPELRQAGPKGVHASIPEYGQLNQPNVIPYFAMPENYHGNQLKSYGGNLRYTIIHSNRGYLVSGPDVVISGNSFILLHQASRTPNPNSPENMEVRLFEGQWVKKSANSPEVIATREEIMMVLEDVDNILIKLQYNEGVLNTTISNIEMDTAAIVGVEPASYVEECRCPVGYSGLSCERCADGYMRHQTGPWLGQCLREPVRCPPGQYNDGLNCQPCPCPHTNPSNQFARTCHLGSDGDVVCDCPPGYVGNRCQQCAPGYIGNPLVTGDSCVPQPPEPQPYCDIQGSMDTRPDAYGRCRCKALTDGSTCNQCKANTFYLNNKNQFGCISCFCMGVTQQCSSSNWYRDKISSIFTSSINDFRLVDNVNRNAFITSGIRLNQPEREIMFEEYSSSSGTYYWTLPSRYLGDKITSYGGNLRYTLKNTPVPGGQSSRNSAADVEIVSKNHVNLLYYNRNQTQPSSTPTTFVIPFLEQYWQRIDGQPADREHLLMVLADLEAIYVKATYYTKTKEFSLIAVEMDIATERNTGSFERALEVEQCHCPVGYTGLSCEDCDIGYTRSPNGIYLGLCEPCSCNGHSNECDAETGVCLNCRDFTHGENCEECLPGYTGNPANGIPCTPQQGTPMPCNCDPRGSVSNECYNGACSCKVNVEGHNCDRCRSGTFGLNASNIYGCEVCFCSGAANECSESYLNLEQIPIQIDNNHRFTLTDQMHQQRITSNFNVDIYHNDISYNFPQGQSDVLYWSLPDTFTGNQIKSYAGKLEFYQKYTQYPSGRYVPDKDIIINGNGVTLFWSNPIEPRENTLNVVSVNIHPSAQWYRIDDNHAPKLASRKDILIALAGIESILIRATQSSDTRSAHLSDIVLDTASDSNTEQPRAAQIEVCRCPQGFRGTSCESCSSGYYKDFDSSKPLGTCVSCPCNGKEESCEVDYDRRVICQCRPGYTGRNCEYEAASTTTPMPNTSTHGSPTIEITIQDYNIGIYEVGNTVRYVCSARSHSAPRTVSVHWTKEGGELPSRAVDDERGVLVIHDLQVQDSGRYTCVASDGYSTTTSSVTLNVGVKEDERPRIDVSQQYIEVNEGQPIEVRCQASGIPAPELSLLRLDGRILSPRAFENGIFRIPQAQISDTADYQCIARNRAGSDSANFQVVVHESIGPLVKVDIQPPSFSGNTGENIILRCVATGNIQSIRWTKQGGELPYDSREDRGQLLISNATPDMSGVYVCTVTVATGTDDYSTGSSKVPVSITGSDTGQFPTAKVSPDRVTISQGQSTELVCSVTGSPLPTVKWTKLNGVFDSNVEQVGTTLYIRNARLEDQGIYVCVATNGKSIAQASVVVEVTRLETPRIDIYPQTTQTINAGDSTSIQCRIVAGYPHPTITWTRANFQPLSRNVEEMSGGVLRIMQITPQEEGEYICTATNAAGSASASAHIIVHIPPKIQVTPAQQDIIKKLGDYLRLECQATGNPEPSVGWTKYGYSGLRYDEARSPAIQNMAYQEFNSLTKQDEGIYICRAESSAGVDESSIRLIVDSPSFPEESLAPPKVYLPPRQEVDPGDDVDVNCTAVGTPPITIRWMRLDGPMPPSVYTKDGYLRFNRIQREHAGRYLCKATNPIGEADSVSEVVVRGPEPPASTMTIYPPENRYRVGADIDIVCRSSERGVIPMWSEISGIPDSDNVNFDGGHLRIRGLKLTNAGTYRCEASGSRGPYYKDITLDVIDLYEDEPTVEVKTVPRGHTVELVCNVDFPEPITYKWEKSGSALPNYIDIYSRVIRLTDVDNSDVGTYVCSANSGSRHMKIPIILVVSGIVPYFTQAPNSYITLRTLPEAYQQFTFEISFKPETGHGLILYNGHNGNKRNGDFISLALDNSIVEFKFNLGSGTTRVFNDFQLSNGEWHTVKVIRNRKKVVMYVDGRGPYTSVSSGQLVGLDLNEPLYIGGVPDPNNISPDVSDNRYIGFVGCIGRFKLGHQFVDIQRDALNKTGITTCEVCNESKCENKGVCQEALSKDGSTCICYTGFSGPTCSRRKNEGCLPDTCGRSGRCFDTENGYECQCPLGRAGNRCEREISIVEPAFQNDAYIAYPTPKQFKIVKITLRIKPNNLDDGLLLYCGETDEGYGDFVSLAIHNKHLEFRFDAGNGPTIVRYDQELIPGEWHVLTASRTLTEGRLLVDGKSPAVERLLNRKNLNLLTPLYIGGYDKHNLKLNDGVKVVSGFNGCISDINVSGLEINMIQNASDASNVQDCSSIHSESDVDNNIYSAGRDNSDTPLSFDRRQTGCSNSPCRNGGQCYPLTPTDYQCLCLPGYSGKSCENIVNICDQRPCQNYGICKGNNTYHSCDCPLGFTGANCEQIVELHNDAHFNGNGYLQFSRDLLNHERDDEPEIIALELSTNTSNGLIFWHGQTPNEDGLGQDYISLSLQNGFLEFSYDLGNGPTNIRDPNVRVNDGERHRVVLKRQGRWGSMEIDDLGPIEKEPSGLTNTMNCAGNIYLGGTPDVHRMTGGRFTQGFNGCIHGFELQDSQRLDVGVKAIGGMNVKPCSRFDDSFENMVY